MGYIYLLKSNKKDMLKIGKTANLEQRMKSFESCSRHLGIEDESFTYLRIIEVHKYDKLETLLHKKFKDKRVIGEWFNITTNDFDNMLKTVDLNEFAKEDIKEVVSLPCFIEDNYVKLDFLLNKTPLQYNMKASFELAKWIERINHIEHNGHLYIELSEVPFLVCTAMWFMVKDYHTRRFFDEFIFFPILDNLKLILTYSQILDLFRPEYEEDVEYYEEDIESINSWINR